MCIPNIKRLKNITRKHNSLTLMKIQTCDMKKKRDRKEKYILMFIRTVKQTFGIILFKLYLISKINLSPHW